MRINLKSKKLVAAAVVATVVTGGSAYAYWTAGGGGDGEAATAAATADVELQQLALTTPMYPGLAPQALTGTIDNPNDGPVYVGTVDVSIASVTPLVVDGDCEIDDYLLSAASFTVNEQALTDGTTTWTGPSISMVNEPSEDQDGCKGATVVLAYDVV